MSDPTRDDVAALTARYEAGIVWLQEHDPTGAFYLWHKSGILPHHPMPAQSEDRRAEYAAYHRALMLWLKLDAKLLRLERRGGALDG